MDAHRSLVAALLALLTAACGSAAALPRDVEPAAASPHPPLASVMLVERLEEQQAAALPDVVGLDVARARSALVGLTVNVVSFGRGPVSAQWPPAGAAPPADGAVVVWVGTPPTLPGPAPAPAAPVAAPAAPVAAHMAPPPAPPAPDQPGGVTPGLEDFVPPPHAPRTNIRELPEAARGQQLSGRASWYGPGFAGHQTACGSVFDPSQHTLASRELRCGTEVTVTGPAGRSVRAVVTDWGPAEWTDRRFDLSQATFAAVAGLGAGVVDVTVEVR